MKKSKKRKVVAETVTYNPVAKFACKFNKAKVYRDKTKYQRTAKHKGKEPFPMLLLAILEKVSVFIMMVFVAGNRLDAKIDS